jgi:uncharacterized membrane protein YhaH (DUF805 family)
MKESLLLDQYKKLKHYNGITLKNYANFKGRASNLELFYAVATHVIVPTIINLITMDFNGILNMLYILIVFTPTLALLFRRLHDKSKKGWICLIPIVSYIIVTIIANNYDRSLVAVPFVIITVFSSAFIGRYLIAKGDMKDNKYGLRVEDTYDPNQMQFKIK